MTRPPGVHFICALPLGLLPRPRQSVARAWISTDLIEGDHGIVVVTAEDPTSGELVPLLDPGQGSGPGPDCRASDRPGGGEG
jgi:hypothetical protein